MEWSRILRRLDRWRDSGERLTPSGTLLIGRVQSSEESDLEDPGPDVWIHEIHAALNEQEIKELSRSLSTWNVPESLPTPFQEFLRSAGGLNLFCDSLCLWGFRRVHSHSRFDAWHPYDLGRHSAERLHHRHPLEGDQRDDTFFFGGYPASGDGVMMRRSNETVHRLKDGQGTPQESWSSLTHFLDSEIDRIETEFDAALGKL